MSKTLGYQQLMAKSAGPIEELQAYRAESLRDNNTRFVKSLRPLLLCRHERIFADQAGYFAALRASPSIWEHANLRRGRDESRYLEVVRRKQQLVTPPCRQEWTSIAEGLDTKC
jgi:hypothetical protein